MAVYYDGYQDKKIVDKYQHLRAFAILLTTKNQDLFVKAYSFCQKGKCSNTGLGMWHAVNRGY